MQNILDFLFNYWKKLNYFTILDGFVHKPCGFRVNTGSVFFHYCFLIFIPCFLIGNASANEGYRTPSIRTELFDSGSLSQDRFLIKEGSDISVVDVQAKSRESGSKSGSKFIGGVSSPDLKIVTPDKVSSDTTKDKESDESFDGQLAIFLGFIFAVLIPMFSDYSQNKQPTPNAELTGKPPKQY